MTDPETPDGACVGISADATSVTHGKLLGGVTGKGFMPGQSGNPSGRPATRSLSRALREKLEEPFPNDPQNRSFAQVIAERLVEQAAGGDLAAAREVLDRAEGRPPQALQIGVETHRTFFEEHPPDETGEQWLKRMGIEQAKLAELEGRDG